MFLLLGGIIVTALIVLNSSYFKKLADNEKKKAQIYRETVMDKVNAKNCPPHKWSYPLDKNGQVSVYTPLTCILCGKVAGLP